MPEMSFGDKVSGVDIPGRDYLKDPRLRGMAVALKLACAPESPGQLVKPQIAGFHSQSFQFNRFQIKPKNLLFQQSVVNFETLGPGPHFENHWNKITYWGLQGMWFVTDDVM